MMMLEQMLANYLEWGARHRVTFEYLYRVPLHPTISLLKYLLVSSSN